jgi:hypothetical protein
MEGINRGSDAHMQYPGTCTGGVRSTMKNLNQDSRCAGQHSNWAPSEWKAEASPRAANVLNLSTNNW